MITLEQEKQQIQNILLKEGIDTQSEAAELISIALGTSLGMAFSMPDDILMARDTIWLDKIEKFIKETIGNITQFMDIKFGTVKNVFNATYLARLSICFPSINQKRHDDDYFGNVFNLCESFSTVDTDYIEANGKVILDLKAITDNIVNKTIAV